MHEDLTQASTLDHRPAHRRRQPPRLPRAAQQRARRRAGVGHAASRSISFDLDNLKLSQRPLRARRRRPHDCRVRAGARAAWRRGGRVRARRRRRVRRGAPRCRAASGPGRSPTGSRRRSPHRTTRPTGCRSRTSFGVAVWPDDGRTKDELIAAADAALYVAKRGRGRRRERRAGDVIEQSVRALSAAIDARDAGTGEHSVTVADLAAKVARRLRFEGSARRRAAPRRAAARLGQARSCRTRSSTSLRRSSPTSSRDHARALRRGYRSP